MLVARFDDRKQYSVMTLMTAAFYFSDLWFITLPLWSLVLAALLFDEDLVLNRWEFWTLVSAVMAVGITQMWIPEGNDYFLIFYLTLIALQGSHAAAPMAVIALNARHLVGIVFSLAFFWKLVSESFRSGAFFTFDLLFEDRLGPLTLYLAGLPRPAFLENRAALVQLDLTEGFTVNANPVVTSIAQVLTWTTIIVEISVAIVFLIPLKQFRYLRDPALLLFCAGAYLVMPVPSFGMCLATLGFAQTPYRVYKTLYLVAYILMPLTATRYWLLRPV